jgi:hypothetical protein
MATVPLTNLPLNGGKQECRILTWEALTTANNDGEAFPAAAYPDKSVQVQGTFGAAATIAIQGCNEEVPVNWYTLTDPQGNSLTFTAAKIEAILENTRWIRPALVSGGDGSTDIDIIMMIVGR